MLSLFANTPCMYSVSLFGQVTWVEVKSRGSKLQPIVLPRRLRHLSPDILSLTHTVGFLQNQSSAASKTISP